MGKSHQYEDQDVVFTQTKPTYNRHFTVPMVYFSDKSSHSNLDIYEVFVYHRIVVYVTQLLHIFTTVHDLGH